ncbi:MAG TPA: nuclear transport factor 2 family protein [Anaeromyxobacteraceae bacterium]|nr:nuclear transport factor 2 family protein [Anaeromyxobacteraceae bacterium]
MPRRAVSVMLTAVLTACAHSPGSAGGDPAAEIKSLDAAGGQAAARRDAAATLANFGDDVVYAGSRGVALGQDGIAAAWKPWFSPDGPLVTWAPVAAGVATSGDLGWSTGRSRVEVKDTEGRPKVLTGEYATVWSKGPGGWKGVLDLAVSRPAAELGPGERHEVRALRSAAGDVEAAMGLWRRSSGEGPRAGGYLTVRRRGAGGEWEVVEDRISPFSGEAPPGELVLLDAAWAWTMTRRDAGGWRALVAEDALFAGRMLRRGREDVWEGWKAFFAEGGPTIRWTPEAGGAAGSDDLAWTSGRWRLERKGADGKPVASEGRYLTVWVRDAGQWRVALDCGLEPAEALGAIERAAVRTLASRDGTLEAAMGTWTKEGPGGRRGAWITVRARAGGMWRTLHDSAVEFPPAR